jgi:hypothetical protein
MFGNNGFRGSPEFGYVLLNYFLLKEISTGKDNNNNTAVITTAHPNKASLCNLIPGLLIFNIVVMTIINKVITFPPPTLKHKGSMKTN